MSENIISWTPCKVKYPPEEGSYFVTVKHLHTNLVAISRFPHDDWARRDIITDSIQRKVRNKNTAIV